MIARRRFLAAIGAATAVARLSGAAHAAGQRVRLAILWPYGAADPLNDVARQALAEAGYAEGRNLVVDWGYGEGDVSRFPALAARLVEWKPDAIMAVGDAAIRSVRQASVTIPIVAASDDLVGEGHVASLARPGGNVTGVSILASELNAKRLEVLKAAVPAAARVAVLWDPATGTFHLPALRDVARALKVELRVEEVRGAGDLERAFDAARSWRAEAVNVLASPLVYSLRLLIIGDAARTRLPAIYQWDEAPKAGGLMSYGPTHFEVLRTMAMQLDQIVRGARPADLPIARPTKFKLVVNLKTANALGVTMPQTLVLRADEVLQ